MGKTMLLMSASDIAKKRDVWLDMKKHYITGTDAGVIMEVNPWNTPLRLYHEKLGHIPTPDISDRDAVRFGTIFEDVVAREFTRRTGIKVHRRGMLLDCQDNSRAANIDRICDGGRAGLECKTTSAFNASEWADDKIPRHYYYQCLHYMLVLYTDYDGILLPEFRDDPPKWYIACLIGGQKFIYKEIPFDQEAAIKLARAEHIFRRRLEENDPPPVSDSVIDEKCLSALNPGTGPAKSIGPKVNELIENINHIRSEIDSLKQDLQGYRNEVIQFLGDSDTAIGDRYKVTYKTRAGGEMVSMTDLKKSPNAYRMIKEAGLIKTRPATRSLVIKGVKE